MGFFCDLVIETHIGEAVEMLPIIRLRILVYLYPRHLMIRLQLSV